MRPILLFLILFFGSSIQAQFINPEFNDWKLVQIGQPYEDPIGWITNNMTDKWGLASTPVRKGIDSSGFFVRIASDAHGIDALGSGSMYQTISSGNLDKIEFKSRCDSIFQTGRCIVRVLGEVPEDVLYVDSISVTSDVFLPYSIDIDPTWILNNDSITLQFIAKGNIDAWDEEEDGYSVYHVDNVQAEYISGSKDVTKDHEINIYPNPTDGIVHMETSEAYAPAMITVSDLSGKQVLVTPFSNTIDLSKLPKGIYIVNLYAQQSSIHKLLFLNSNH